MKNTIILVLVMMLVMPIVNVGHAVQIAEETYLPVEDSYVSTSFSGQYDDENYGSETSVDIGTFITTDVGYVLFDASEWQNGEIHRAFFSFYVGSHTVNRDYNVNIYRIDDKAWSEEIITYNNRPSDAGKTLIATKKITTSGRLGFEITQALIDEHDKKLSLVIEIDGSIGCTFSFYSKENPTESYQPQLNVIGVKDKTTIDNDIPYIVVRSNAVLDTYIRPQQGYDSWPDAHGSDATISVTDGAGYVTFAMPEIKQYNPANILSVKVNMYAINGDDGNIGIYGFETDAADAWEESEVNRRAQEGEPDAYFHEAQNRWYLANWPGIEEYNPVWIGLSGSKETVPWIITNVTAGKSEASVVTEYTSAWNSWDVTDTFNRKANGINTFVLKAQGARITFSSREGYRPPYMEVVINPNIVDETGISATYINTDSKSPITLYTAYYDENDNLIDLLLRTEEVGDGEKAVLKVGYSSKKDSAEYVKMFLWDDVCSPQLKPWKYTF